MNLTLLKEEVWKLVKELNNFLPVYITHHNSTKTFYQDSNNTSSSCLCEIRNSNFRKFEIRIMESTLQQLHIDKNKRQKRSRLILMLENYVAICSYFPSTYLPMHLL